MKALHRVLSSSAYLLTPPLINLTLRLLLAFSLSPHFFNSIPSSSACTSFGTLPEALSLVPHLRIVILRCINAALQSSAREAPGLLDHAVNVFRTGLRSNDSKVREICTEGIGTVELVARPTVPPLLRTKGIQIAVDELSGGRIDTAKIEMDTEVEMHLNSPAEHSFSFTATRAPEVPSDPALHAARISFTPTNTSLQLIPPEDTYASLRAESLTSTGRSPTTDGLATAHLPDTLDIVTPYPTIGALEQPSEAAHVSLTTASEASAPAVPLLTDFVGSEDVRQKVSGDKIQDKESSSLAALASPKRGTVTDSDDDDDAPMPKIYMDDSDSEDRNVA